MEKEYKITGIRDETHDVRTFRLEGSIEFIPGQYCLVSVADNEELKEEKRPFTFTSSPADKEYFELTIKKIGKFTSYLHSLKAGDILVVGAPKGDALNFDESVKKDVVFIAGGSGITPFISALRYAAAKKLPNNLILLYSNRTYEDIIYRKEFDEMGKKDNIKIIHTLSNEAPEGWKGETGKINREMIEKYVKEQKERIWYVCAPPPMVKAMKEILLGMGIPKENLRIEDWQIAGKHDNQ